MIQQKWQETLAEKELCLDSLKKQNDVLFSQITEVRFNRMNDDVLVNKTTSFECTSRSKPRE